MFDNLRRAFSDAVSNFKDEIGRDDVPEAVDELLRGMVSEVTDAKAYAKKLEGEIEQVDAKVAKQKKGAQTARRRQALAEKIDDQETAQVAKDFAEKHERIVAVLEQKAAALRQELKVQQGEVTNMMAQLKSARADRDRLTATAGLSQTKGTLSEADDLFAQMDRMAEKIEGTQSEADAARELDDLGLGNTGSSSTSGARPSTDPDLEEQFEDLEHGPREIDFDAALDELKRRMGKE